MASSRRAPAQPAPGLFVVRCEHFTTQPPVQRETAERRLAEIVALGACSGTHEIVPAPE